MASDWPVSRWDLTHLSNLLQDQTLSFRMGKRTLDTEPQFETQCEYIDATISQFRDWICGCSEAEIGPFGGYNRTESWAYADYKYLATLFNDRPGILQEASWADFGFADRDGRDSTLWVGSAGANTPCHMDSYGCNLVLQVDGRKKWHLFPPEDSAFLYPTRIPYEESSVFSKVNVVNPDRRRYPSFSSARPHVVTLHPGQVLLVPRHWWHYVESLDDVTISVNTWIELDVDHEARVEEAITRMVVCAFKSVDSDTGIWVNPTEDGPTSHETNLQYLNDAVSVYAEHRSAEGGQRVDRGGETARKRRRTAGGQDSVEYGQDLVPVLPLAEDKEAEKDGDCSAPPSLGSITSDDVLDCLLNPQVVRLVAQLLLSGRSGR